MATTKEASQSTEWDPALRVALATAAKSNWYGSIRIEITAGTIRRVLIERSVMNPKDLAADEPQSVG